jgi:hypothetical protein
MKKSRTKSSRLIIILVLVAVIVLAMIIWVLAAIFEGEKPLGQLEPLPEYLSKSTDFRITASDQKRGLRALTVKVKQQGPSITILKKDYPYKGLFNKEGTHSVVEEFTVDSKKLSLAQGQVHLTIEMHDYSKRRGGDGNLTIVEHKMMVDTIPPSMSALSRSHNVTIGGSCLVIYKTSTDAIESGVFVNDLFFPGVPCANDQQSGMALCYFAIPYYLTKDLHLSLWAKDKAGNEGTQGFYYHIRQKRFRSDKIQLSDRLLDTIVSSFPSDLFEPGQSQLDKYLRINKGLREENYNTLKELCQTTTEKKLWDGTWLRMKNAATMATFGDKRTYYYKGEVVDKAVHGGVDLASLARSPIQAANSGRVVFAKDLGIYGRAVIIDHGQGLFTLYGHLSEIDVAVDQLVAKGDKIGTSGSTGLATGDHLHFGFLVHGIPVNPVEWWDPHWIKDNIYRKLGATDKLSQR